MNEQFQEWAITFARLAWGPWLLVLLLGGGLYFLISSRFLPFKYLPHGVNLLLGRYGERTDVGEVSHFQALSTALAGTIGMGNIGGVALAIAIGGPGVIFWMWLTAILGVATKFFTCTLSVHYRWQDPDGHVHGGPMYVIKGGLPKQLHFLAYWFAIAGLFGCLPMFATNQMVQVLREPVFIENGWLDPQSNLLPFNLGAGAIIAFLTGCVVLGGVKRIGRVAAATVPTLVLVYVAVTAFVLVTNFTAIPSALALIVNDAFTGNAVLGGGILSVIQWGVQRGAFSNEAGIGTESLAHGAARTNEPVREGLVAMWGPIIDTLIVSTATAIVIILSGAWVSGGDNGVTLTANAFREMLGPFGLAVVLICSLSFGLTTLFTYSFYVEQCAHFLFGPKGSIMYRYIFIGLIVISAVLTLQTIVGIVDGMFALMAIPTMVSALWLSPKVMVLANDYFSRLEENSSDDARP